MEKKILSFNEKQQFEQLAEFLKDVPLKKIDSLIDEKALRNKGELIGLVKAFINGSNSEDAFDRRLHVFEHCISLLMGKDLSSNLSSELLGILLVETDGFTAEYLTKLADIYIDAVKNGIATSERSLDLFPKILSSIASQEKVIRDGTSTSGQDYKSHLLNSLFAGRWARGSVVHLASMLKEVPMSDSELIQAIRKLLRLCRELALQELPPLIYQLLLLASKGHKKIVLDGIVSLFEEKDKQCKKAAAQNMDELSEMVDDTDELRKVEGTVLTYFDFAVKQDQDLGRELIKGLKANQQTSCEKSFSPFTLALAMSTARIPRFTEQVNDILKATVLKSYKELEKQRQSQFVNEMTTNSCDLADLIMDTVKIASSDWEYAAENMVRLGFVLMDSYGPKGAFGKIQEGLPTRQKKPTEKTGDMGAKILLETFKTHDSVRVEIVSQILDRVLTKVKAPVTHFMDLFSVIVRTAPHSLMECLPRVKETLDYLAVLPLASSQALLKAIQPMLKFSANLKDALVLSLRKAMFSKQPQARRIAVGGFLLILQNFKVIGSLPLSQSSQSSSSSQVSVEVYTPHNTATNEALCLEVLGNLRRCLQQQAEVRFALYEGLYDVLCNNTQLALPMLGMLTSQFAKFYEKTQGTSPPVKLQPCVLIQGESVSPNEPLAHLVSCMVHCALKTREIQAKQPELEEDDGQREVEEMLKTLSLRMIKCDLEDFELDKSSDFSAASTVGQKNNVYLLLVVGLYEALIEYNFCSPDFDAVDAERIIGLFKPYHKLAQIAREKASGGSNGNGSKKGSAKQSSSGAVHVKNTPRSLLSIKTTTLLMRTLFCEVEPNRDAGARVLKENGDFMLYVITVAMQKIQQISDIGTCDGPDGHNQKKLFAYMAQISRVMLETYSAYVEGLDGAVGRIREVYSECLRGFTLATATVFNRFPHYLVDYIKTIDYTNQVTTCADGSSLSEEDLLYKQTQRLQRLVVLVLRPADDRGQKDAEPLLSVVGLMYSHLPRRCQQLQKILDWVRNVCLQHSLDDTGVAKKLLSLLFSLAVQEKSVLPVLGELSRDIHCLEGDIDQGVEIKDKVNFGIVTPRTSSIVLLTVLNQLDRELEDTEWILARLKADTGPSASDAEEEAPNLTQREGQEKLLVSRLGQMINVLHELSQAPVPVGTCMDTLIRTSTKLYTTLTLVTKYYTTLFVPGSVFTRFEKLVSLSGRHLTPYIYAMITYIQASQSEHLQDRTKDKKKKLTAELAQAAKAKVLKESRGLPTLVYSIEQYENSVIALQKKSKNEINLMHYFRTSTSRDFRIQVENIQEAESSGEEETEDGTQMDTESDDRGGGQENEAPPRKKRKTASSDGEKKQNSAGLQRPSKKNKGLSTSRESN